ncbi:GAF and ANTAR domain-containing protein [Modestobacter muralis]|uniref:GAF and ANTAR domain-containing protein n=1 Tax=Modestobacter muralis TaxID=1608614 RepID=A0A6P0HBK2_9ACTN|nr:GAF and ANTAR domain-containing protein [Modestobacter muralis]NEK96378.1 GAF and ANTAR domain-containing protein [Modestobacter muralis]NEN53278.1 GAF and ANTAR domain-containing protein [Modestobacter muralis]
MPTPNEPLPAKTDRALQDLSALTLRRHSMDTLLQAVVDATASTLPGHVDSSISVLIGSRPATAVYTGQLALDLDESQYERGHGPCLHAATTGELVEITDARTETRWPDYTPRAVERHALSSLSVPLPMEGLHAGLNIYATEADAFDDATQSAAREFARSAAAAIANMYDYQTARDIAANLELALQSRAVIDQAKGILMERQKLTADQAFQTLAYASQAANVKLRDIADHLVRTGEMPQPPRRS